jgi:replication factor C subunit 2/4
MRKAIMYMQSVARLGGGVVDAGAVANVAGALPNELMHGLASAWHSGSVRGLFLVLLIVILSDGAQIDHVYSAAHAVTRAGHSASAALAQMHDTVLADASINDMQRALALSAIALADKALIDGADESLQLMQACASVMRAVSGLPL